MDDTKTILIIDDEKTIRECFKFFLEDLEYNTLEADGGEKGLAIFQEMKPDAVFLDLKMPGMDGLTVLSKLKELADNTPVIVISGTGIIADALNAIHYGAWDYIMKPIQDLSIIEHTLDRAFERAKLIEENENHQKYLESEVEKRTKELEAVNAELQRHKNNLEEEVKERTAELHRTHKQLIEKAHMAGMATISTDILHNIGNLLNSVIISAQAVEESLNMSSLARFTKANNLIRDNLNDLQGFIINEPKLVDILQYYLKIEELLKSENLHINEQLERLYEKIGAIENVISLQQNYAKPTFLSEYLSVEDLVNDALVLLQDTIYQNNIKVTKEFKETPMVSVQRAKLIHVLINIIQNARDSMNEIMPEVKKLLITIDYDDQFVYIIIKDNGAGIAEGQLTDIFTHGFTTKENGHGFGLHSCANYVSEMGGVITAESEGIGHGAVFKIKLPIEY